MATVARTPDAEVLRRLSARDATAWDLLYREHQPRLRAFAYRLAGNVHDADDLVQETFVRAVPRLDRLDPDTTDVSAYLFATLKNLFLKQVERRKRQEPMAEVPEPALPAPIEDDPQRSLLLKSQQYEVRIANARLQPRQRLVLALRELEDRSYAEIGELVGMKENAVAQRIFRAREGLRTELRLAQVDPEQLPEECRRFLPLLAAHLDGQLKGARQKETLAHLESCERCQAALADMQEASRRYRTIFLPPLAADEARAAVDERLEAVGYWSSTAANRRARRFRSAGALAAAALVLGGGGAALGVGLTRDDATEAVATTAPVSTERTTTTAADRTEAVTTEPAPPPPPKPKQKQKVVAPAVTETSEPAIPPTAAVTPPPTTAPAVTTTPKAKPKAKPTPAPRPEPAVTSQPPAADTKAPIVTIASGPAAATATDAAEIGFKANEAAVSFFCSFDGAAYTACVSPAVLTALAAGQHQFAVKGEDKAGNVGAPASVTWTYTPPDTTPPVVTIGSGPASPTTDTGASFTFSSNEPGSSFACSLDGGAFAPCGSPASYTSLAVGSHSFAVQAADTAGNTGAPATHTWTVVAPLPDLLVGALAKNSITIRNQGPVAAGPSTLTITLVGTFSVPSIQPGASITFSWSTCRVGTYSAIVDRTNVVAESDETNNRASRVNTCP